MAIETNKDKRYDNNVAEMINLVLVCLKKCLISTNILEKTELENAITYVAKQSGIPRLETRALELLSQWSLIVIF